MHISQVPYADLYQQILQYDGTDLFGDVLQPWLKQHQETERSWVQTFGAASNDKIPHADIEDLWRLYAISRVSDILLCCLPTVINHPNATSFYLSPVSLQ